MKFAGRFIDLLGQQMYGGAVPAVAELIANAWDADAPSVEITVPPDPTSSGAEIVVSDTGTGMTFEELNTHYLSIGYERRARGERSPGGRLVMGRKGIGKLAGFGIAEDIYVKTVKQGHVVEILLNYASLRSRQSLEGVALEPTRDESCTEPSGVTVTFRRLKLRRAINVDAFRKSMGRRFALATDAMAIQINGQLLAKDHHALEFREPVETNTWKSAEVPGFGPVKYWFGFLTEPVADPELRGLSVLARGRLAQATPFFFNLAGGITGQVGLEYLTGQVSADGLDDIEDCIATDRQTVNWQFEVARSLENWGKDLVKEACKEWKKRRKKQNLDSFTHDYSELFARIKHLPEQEREDVVEALDRISELENINPSDFQVISRSLLEGVERESVKKVIRKINTASDEGIGDLISVIKEWDVISAVATAETVAGRIEIIKQFQTHIENRLKEKARHDELDMQGFVKSYPWLLGPEFDNLEPADFHHEHGVDKWIEEVLLKIDGEYRSSSDKKEGRRFDLLCIRDDMRVVVLELMRPGLPGDYDHLTRLNRYVTSLQAAMHSDGTKPEFRSKTVYGLLIADANPIDASFNSTLNTLRHNLDSVTWQGLFKQVQARYKEFFATLRLKAPEDPRIKGLANLEPK